MKLISKGKYISMQCIALTKKGERCKKMVRVLGSNTQRVECHIHKRKEEIQRPKKKYEKPEECPVCYCDLNDEKKPLECGHWVHLECAKKHFKPECPVCRFPLNIKTSGTRPEEIDDIPPELLLDYFNNDPEVIGQIIQLLQIYHAEEFDGFDDRGLLEYVTQLART